MSERSGFFPYVAGDSNSEYKSDFLAKLIASFIGNGVFTDELAVTAGSNMQIKVPAGRAWINGYFYRNDGDMTFDIANADGVLNRKDTVVLRWNINSRAINLKVLEGTPASTATAPEITRGTEQYDLKLAEISIPAGTTAITQSLITDTRLNNDVCGIVTGVIDQVKTTTFYNQIAADLAEFKAINEAGFTSWSTEQKQSFQTWFDGIKNILGTDEATKLLNMINAHIADTVAHMTQAQKDQLAAAVANTRTINGHALSANITLTKSDIGLGNVDNTADANKSVKYAATAGSAPANGGTANYAHYASGSIGITTPGLRNIQISTAQASSYLGLGVINIVIE